MEITGWLWALLIFSFITTILFGIANAKRLNKLEDDWKKKYGRNNNNNGA